MLTAGLPRSQGTTAIPSAGFPVIGSHIFNGGTWEPMRSIGSAQSGSGTGAIGVGLMAFDSAVYTRLNTTPANGDGTVSSGSLQTVGWVFNGTNYDRNRNNSAANISATTQKPLSIGDPGEWTENSSVAAAGTPSASHAAGAAGVRHVCRNLTIALANVNAAASALITLHLRDGATGAGTIKRTWQVVVPAANSIHINIAGLNIFGTAATAMTLESAAALPADVSGVCALGGYSTI